MKEQSTVNYIEFIENAGFELGPKVSDQVAAMSEKQLSDFRDSYLALNESFEAAVQIDPSVAPTVKLEEIASDQIGVVFSCPKAEPNEFRAMLHGRLHHTGPAMLGGDSGSDFDELNLDVRLSKIKAQLLYAHSLVVSDSLFYINQYFRPTKSDNPVIQDFVATGRRRLQNYLSLISVLKPLIQKDVIIFYPQYEHAGGGVGFGGHEGLKSRDFEDWVEAELPPNISAQDRLRVESGYEFVNELLFFSDRYDATLCLPSKLYEAPLDYVNKFTERAVLKDKRLAAEIQWHLAQVDLPALSSLPLEDVVRIRRDDETFETWRGLLKDAIGQIENPANLSSQRIVSEVQSMLADGQAKVEKSLKKSGVLDIAKGPAGAFTLSSLGKLAATGHLDLKTAAATAGISFLWQYIAGSGKRKAVRSLKAHLASFSGMAGDESS